MQSCLHQINSSGLITVTNIPAEQNYHQAIS
jgi:hypothetical protein